MDILGPRRSRERAPGPLRLAQQRQPLLDRGIPLVQIRSSPIRIDSIRDLVIARLVERPEVEPDFGDVRVDFDGARIGVERIAVLIYLEVQHADAAPERRVTAIAVDSLLVGLVGLLVLGHGHVGAAEQVPGLSVRSICSIDNRRDRT
jgi:hypothetical protein